MRCAQGQRNPLKTGQSIVSGSGIQVERLQRLYQAIFILVSALGEKNGLRVATKT